MVFLKDKQNDNEARVTDSIFSHLKQQMRWLTERQKVISENVTNARRPNYLPKDLKPFSEKLKTINLSLTNSHPNHLQPSNPSQNEMFEIISTKSPDEAGPNGNAVVLEEEIFKSSETNLKFKEASALFERYAKLRKAALGKK